VSEVRDPDRCIVCGGVLLDEATGSSVPPHLVQYGVCSQAGIHSTDEAERVREQIAQRRLAANRALADAGVRSPLTREDEDEILAACSDAYRRGYEDGRRAAAPGKEKP
jgi:hypothetical protein